MASRTRRIAPALMAAALILGAPLLTACGQAAESIVENAAEAAGAGDVDIEDGQVTVENSEGTMVIGEDVELPDTWPSEVPVPDGATLMSVVTQADSGGATGMWTIDGDPADVGAAYDAQLTSAGFTKGSDMGAAGIVGGEYTGNGLKVSVLALGAEGKTSITVNAEPDAG